MTRQTCLNIALFTAVILAILIFCSIAEPQTLKYRTEAPAMVHDTCKSFLYSQQKIMEKALKHPAFVIDRKKDFEVDISVLKILQNNPRVELVCSDKSIMKDINLLVAYIKFIEIDYDTKK